MFSMPDVFMTPVFATTVAATLEWAAVGALFAWMLVLVLLGASVGLLREYTRRPSVPSDAHDVSVTEQEIDADLRHVHREAA